MGKKKTKITFKHLFVIVLALFIVVFFSVTGVFVFRYSVATRLAKRVVKQTAQDSTKHLHLLVVANIHDNLVTSGVKDGVYFEYPEGVAIKSSWISPSSNVGVVVFQQESSYQVVNAFSRLHNGIYFDKKSITLTEIFGESVNIISSQDPKFASLGILLTNERKKDKFIPLSSLGIDSISLESVNYQTKNLSNDDLQLATLYTQTNNTLNTIYELDLLNDPSDWVYHVDLNVKISPSFVSNSKNRGVSLDDAVALSPKLHQLVQSYNGGINTSDAIVDNIISTWADTLSLKKTLADDLANSDGVGIKTNLSPEYIAKLKILERFTGDYGAVRDFKLPVTHISHRINTNKLVTPTEIYFESKVVSASYQELTDSVVKLLANYNEFSSEHTSQLMITN